MQEHGKNRPSPAPCTGSRGQPHVPGTWQPTGTGSCGQPHVPGTWQLSATRPRHVAAHRPKEPHPLTNGLRAAAAVRAHPVTWAASRGQATMCHYTPGRCQLQALLPSTLKAVGTLMFQQTATDGQSYMETWGVTEAEGGRLTGRVPGPAEPTTQARWRGPCVPSSAPLEGALRQIEGALCPQLSPNRRGPVSPAQPRWRGPCVHSSPPMERALCPQLTLGASRPHPPPLPLPALSRPFLLAASRQKKPPLTLPGTVFSRLLCLNLKSACSVFRPTWLRKSAWEMSRYEKETSDQAFTKSESLSQ